MQEIICYLNDLKIPLTNIVRLELEKDNNNVFLLNVIINKSVFTKINNSNFITCKVLINDKEYFVGNIKSIQIENNLYKLQFTNHDEYPHDYYEDQTLIERFKINNPSLFQRRNNYNGSTILNNIEQHIIKDSLKITIDKSLPISELDLRISASWNKLCTGYCDLTNKINNKLKDGLISTLTPNKLIKSWPRLFDRLITNNSGALKTKYFVVHSKLDEYNSNKIKINTDKKAMELHEVSFKCKLSVGWEYSQFTTEDVLCKIVNNTIKNNNKQILNINLHNVQEYIEDIYSNSFFKSNIGNSIFNIILCESKQFIINSMQNVKIAFKIPFIDSIHINQLIHINNYLAYVVKIVLTFANNSSIGSVTCVGSEYNNAFVNAELQNIIIDNIKDNDSIIDVLDDINITNTSEAQLQKINNIKDCKLINNILNENPTKLIIKLKPIKTEYNKIEKIDIGTMDLLENTT